MKLSLSTDAMSSYRREGMDGKTVLENIRKAGFVNVDYDMVEEDWLNPKKNGSSVRDALDELGMNAPQGHIPCWNPILPEHRPLWGSVCTAIRFCREAGIPRVVVHPGAVDGNSREEFFDVNIAFFKSLIPVCEETGVRILIENIGNYADPYFLRNGSELREMVDGVGHPLFEACWDTGHANHFYPKDCRQYDSILALGDKLTAIHFQDNVGDISDPWHHSRLDMHMPPFVTWAGSLNYDAVMQGLVDIGYRGTLNFEVSAMQIRRQIEPQYINGVELNRLRLPPPEIWVCLYKAVYEIGKYMLEAYGVFEA